MHPGQPVRFTPPPSPRAASSSSSSIPPERQRLRPVGAGASFGRRLLQDAVGESVFRQRL
eukprot:11595981-Alexandrium_andersonii.AAC.1